MTFDWTLYTGEIEWLPERTLYVTRHGSHSYGTNTPTSDLDLRGIAIPPRDYPLGFLHNFEQVVQTGDVDLTVFELRKFFRLAADSNPNALEILFTDPSDHLYVHPLMERLLANKELFLSRRVYTTFSGYARGQLARIRGHREWLLHPPTKAPERQEFGLPERTVIPADQLAAAQAGIRKKLDSWEWRELENLDPDVRLALQLEVERRLAEITLWGQDEMPERLMRAAAASIGYDTNFIELLDRERRYKAAANHWQQYQDWQRNRNPARSELEAKFGFDTKHAMHLVRLTRSCRELLTEGVLRVRRLDAQELLEIRGGAWTFDQLMEYADREDSELRELVKSSPLPAHPDRVKLNQICVEMMEAMP